MMQEFKKKYQLWQYADHGYQFTEYDTLKEVVAADKYTSWYITRRVNLDLSEAEE